MPPESATREPVETVVPVPAAGHEDRPVAARHDPRLARAYPAIVTGLLGGVFIGMLMLAHAQYAVAVLGGGGPNVEGALRWIPGGPQSIARDFYDFWAVVVLGYVAMGAWENLRLRSYRRILLTLMAASCLAAWAVSLGATLGTTNAVMHLAGTTVTRMELIFAGTGVGLLFLIAVFVARERRASFERATLRPALRSGFWRWLAAYATLLLVAFASLTHPLLRGGLYANWRIFVSYLVVLFVFPGLPYFILTCWMRYRRNEDHSDAGFGLLVVYHFLFRIHTPGGWRRFRRIIGRRWVRTNLMDLFCVKFFFLPIMVGFLFIEVGGLRSAVRGIIEYRSQAAAGPFPFGHLYDACMRWIFTLDVTSVCIGYAGSSRWLGNKSRSVEPTMFGWVVAIMCYPPFNTATHDILPVGRQLPGTPLLLSDGFVWGLRLLTLLCFVIFVLSTLSFGLRFSNMTHRGIIRHGPYAVVRHPAYISKVIAWWAENLPVFTNPWQAVGLFFLSGVYYLRAITEERHLLRDPEYEAYCRKVRYRFIPGVY